MVISNSGSENESVAKNGEQTKLPCLVADSAAFLRNVDLQNLSDHIFTIKEVVGEIRDATTKQRLAVLPYELDFRSPSAESLQFVTEFSKKTGDYKALSAVDLRVLALTHQLEKEFCSVDHIISEPSKKSFVVQKSQVRSDKEISGFYVEQKKPKDVKSNDTEMTEPDLIISEPDSKDTYDMDSDMPEQVCDKEENVMNDSLNLDGNTCDNNKGDAEENKEDSIQNNNDDNDVEEDNDSDDDGGGWITPKNLNKVNQTFGTSGDIKIEESNVKCACLTTDFAMQNVLIQMGLHVLSVQGMLIRQARSYIQKCFGCYKETHDMTRMFCPSCGNKTLKKVAVTIAEDGTMQYHYPKNYRKPNIRGTKFSIPAPKGGRHVDSILLAEDQPMGRNRMPRTRDKADPLDPDYCARTNPFSVNDVNSRAFNLGLHLKQKQPRNPNESRKKKSGRR